MMTSTRYGVVMSLLVGVLLKTATQVDGLTCYVCKKGKPCGVDQLNGREQYCPSSSNDHCATFENIDLRTNSSIFQRLCISDAEIAALNLKRNDCVRVELEFELIKRCACNYDLCIGDGSNPPSTRAPKTTTTPAPWPAPPQAPEQPPPPAPATTSPGLKCYVCDIRKSGPCTDEDAKEKEQKCNVNHNLCTKSNVEGSPMAIRGCMSLEVATYIGLKKNECVKIEKHGVNVDSCTCDKDLCNGAESARTSSALILFALYLLLST